MYYTNTAASIWGGWADATTNGATTTGNCWSYWVTNATSTFTVTDNCTGASTAVWGRWNVRQEYDAQQRAEYERVRAAAAESREIEAAQVQAHVHAYRLEQERKRREEAERLLAEERKRREAAEKLAMALLIAHLNTRQREEYETQRQFTVHKPDGSFYVVKQGRHGNISRVVNGQVVERLCVHPIDDVPDCDTMLAQKLMLECDEQAIRKVANITQPRPYAYVAAVPERRVA